MGARRRDRTVNALCPLQRAAFNCHDCSIRYFPNTRKFVFVNFINEPELMRWYGKALALDIDDHHALFPSAFLLHEMRARGVHPFEPVAPEMPDNNPWQDWLLAKGAVTNDSREIKREAPPRESCGSSAAAPPTTGAGCTTQLAAMVSNLIEQILKATRESASWNACVMEWTSWEGTAEENIRKYAEDIGVAKDVGVAEDD